MRSRPARALPSGRRGHHADRRDVAACVPIAVAVASHDATEIVPAHRSEQKSGGLVEVAVGSAGGAWAARPGRLAWFPPAADIEPCMRFSRTRLPDVLHRWAFSVPLATAGWVEARRRFR